MNCSTIWLDTRPSVWLIRCRLKTSDSPSILVPELSEWYVQLADSYPFGKLRFYPSKKNSLSKTFPQAPPAAWILLPRIPVLEPFGTTTLIDDISNPANACYAAWPERIYIVDTAGIIVYKSGVGPGGFRLDEAEQALRQHLGLSPETSD